MILKQYYLGCLAHASYLVADEESRTAAVVDPQRDVDLYLSDAQACGVTIRHVLLTHFHADFVATAAPFHALDHGHGLPMNGGHGLHRCPGQRMFAPLELFDLCLVTLAAGFRCGRFDPGIRAKFNGRKIARTAFEIG